MSIQSELKAIREAAAFSPLTDRAFLRITGADTTRWLNGMVTNSIPTLAPGEGNYNFLLNAQGRIQGDCNLYREYGEEPAFLLETAATQLPVITAHFDRFIIMDDVELTPALVGESSLLLLGPKSPDALRQLGLPALDPLHLAHADTEHGQVLVLTPPSASVPQFELHASTATIAALRQTLVAAGLPEVSDEAFENLRILEMRPKFGQDIRDRDLPQETSQTHALHFSKGCYLGQEIVERIHSRGQVHRAFTQFHLTGQLPSVPTPLEAAGKPVGELTSAVQIDDRIVALGYLRREALAQALTYTGGTATPLTRGS